MNDCELAPLFNELRRTLTQPPPRPESKAWRKYNRDLLAVGETLDELVAVVLRSANTSRQHKKELRKLNKQSAASRKRVTELNRYAALLAKFYEV